MDYYEIYEEINLIGVARFKRFLEEQMDKGNICKECGGHIRMVMNDVDDIERVCEDCGTHYSVE